MPEASISIDGNALYCDVDSLLFYNLESSYDSLTWSFSHGFQTNNEQFYLDLDTGSYEAILTSYNYCGPNADTVQFVVNLTPALPNGSCYMEHDSLFILWDADVNADSMLISVDGGSTWVSTAHFPNGTGLPQAGDSVQTMIISQTTAGCMSDPFTLSCYLTEVGEIGLDNTPFWISDSHGESLLKANELAAGEYQIHIYDMTGRELNSNWVAHAGGPLEVILPTENKPTGTYLVRIEHKGSVVTLRWGVGR